MIWNHIKSREEERDIHLSSHLSIFSLCSNDARLCSYILSYCNIDYQSVPINQIQSLIAWYCVIYKYKYPLFIFQYSASVLPMPNDCTTVVAVNGSPCVILMYRKVSSKSIHSFCVESQTYIDFRMLSHLLF